MIPNLQLKNLLNLQNNSANKSNLIPEDLLKDNFTEDQDKNIENFIIAIALCLGIITVTFSYLNFINKEELKNLNTRIEEQVNLVKSKSEDATTYQNRITSLNKIKSIESSSSKYADFFSQITLIFEMLKNQTLVSFSYSQPIKNNFNFTLIVNSPRIDLFNELKTVVDSKTSIKGLTLLNKLKLQNSNDFQYEIKGTYESK